MRLLTTLAEKKALLKAAGIDRIEVIPFTREFAAMKAQEYLEMLKARYGASLVVMGYDNHIGADKLTAGEIGSFSYTAEGGHGPGNYLSPLPVMVVAPCHSERSEESPISSTKIRKALEAGDVERANGMLGYDYELYGVVVAGNRLGRTIGFPTANMQLYEPLKLVPANGVYAVEVEVDGRNFRGMCNIGVRPTVGGAAQTIETHILDFDEDIYGLPIGLRFLRRIRDERKFPSLDALKEQLARDALICKK